MLLLPISAAFAASDVVFSVERGRYDAPLTLELSGSEGGAVYYGLDGAAPSLPYAGPLTIAGTTTVRAFVVGHDGASSPVRTSTYLFVADTLADPVMDTRVTTDATWGPVLETTLRELPALVLTGDGDLGYAEEPLSVEWMDPTAASTSLVDAGARRVGGHSVVYAKNSIRLAFRSTYGYPRWEVDLYGDDATGLDPVETFDALTLRGGNHDSVFYLGARGQYLRNLWMDESQLEMGHPAPHGRFAHAWLDGQYIGLYHVRERFNAAFLADYLGGSESDYEAINGGRAFDGSGTAWAQVVAARSRFAEARHWLDVPNFLDYMILNFYAGNAWDWSPDHNWVAAGPTQRDAGGFRFQSSDSDICLYYDYTVNILTNQGPSSVFGGLVREGDPDFQVALADAIHRNLEGEGPLTATQAGDRYRRIAALAEDAVVAESARWGGGWWDREGEWIPERDNLLTNWFPYRTTELLRQVRAAGWYPVPAPGIDPGPGLHPVGTDVVVTLPDGAGATVFLTRDGSDPREDGGATAASAVASTEALTVPLEHGAWIHARLKVGGTWGPVEGGFYEVDEPAALVLNEWNSVEEGGYLEARSWEGSGEDAALGRIPGNGGDWIEFVVTEDHLDLRGWRLELADARGDAGALQLTDDPLWADLRAGTLFTIAEDLPEDAAYDPEAGDWRFHVRAGEAGSGRYISATPFDVTHRGWQLTAYDADGWVRLGPAGEGVSPLSGLGSDEVGVLAEDPSPAVRRDTSRYIDGARSTYGSPNAWSGGEQDLTALRGVPDGRVDTGWADSGGGGADTSTDPPGDSGADTSGPPTDTSGGGCGCATPGGAAPGPGGAAGVAFLAALGYTRRRARPDRAPWAALVAPLVAALLGLAGCTGPDPGETGDTPGDTSADSGPEHVPDDTGEPSRMCHRDEDGDGWGDPDHPVADCADGVHDASDCDDDRADVNPGAPEVCDGRDDDCDGRVDDDDDDLADGIPFFLDGDGDGYGAGEVVLACTASAGRAVYDGDCDDGDPSVHPGAAEVCDAIDQDCDGSASDAVGMSPDCPATSCLDALEQGVDADGALWLTLPSGTLTQVWCDMTTDGGGWTLGFVRNSADTGNQGDFGAGEVAVEALATSPDAASSSSTALRGWFDLNDAAWDELRLSGHANGARFFLSQSVPRASLRIPFGSDGYYLYGGDSPYYWCGGDRTYTDGRTGAVNNPTGAPTGCKNHGSLGSGWDFSTSPSVNQGLTLCGADGSALMTSTWGGGFVYYPTAGAAHAMWVR